ncbi:hypothetical protein [Nonomuraea sp. NPDC059022]|uniref:hypothetical protein n=1 Tax=Nonomuraea sp. NPDC059022 TaxID=3346705 RepID=UPI0036BCA666
MVGHEAQCHVVVLLVHVGQQFRRPAHGRQHRPDRRERRAGAPLRVHGRGEAVAFAGERDAVVAVARGDVERRVHPAREQVVVDQPVPLRHAQPGLQLQRRRRHHQRQVLAVVAGARLELQRGERLVRVVHGGHERVADVQVGDVAHGEVAQVVVGARGELRPAPVGAVELADADRVGPAAPAAGSVDVDQVRHAAHPVCLGPFAQEGEVAGVAVAVVGAQRVVEGR